MKRQLLLVALLACLSPLWALDGAARDAKPKAPAAKAVEAPAPKSDPYTELLRGGMHGPTQVALRDQAHIDLPQGYVFLPEEPAKALMKQFGNATGNELMGVILPEKDGDWLITMDYIASGYIKDDDAKNWNADELLQSLKDGTVEDNKRRAAEHVAELEITGWAEKPRYDATTHRLVWSVALHDKGVTDPKQEGVNYRTLMLGRQGYIGMVMVTDLASIEAKKPVANLLLSKLNFVSGKGYGDFNSSTDRVAEFGLAALIAGLAVKKLGLIAVIAAFAVKFAKVIAIGAIAGAAGLRRFLGRSKQAQ